MEEYKDEFKDYVVSKKITTCQNHYWVKSENQDANSNLMSVNCRDCFVGANIDSDKFEVSNGEINAKV